jgi:MSHA biogenesis protein MshP
MNGARRRQRGVVLIAAIFLVVVMGALSAYLLTISGTMQYSSLTTVLDARASSAARAGVEWAVYEALQGGGGACSNSPGTTTSFTLTQPGLNGYSVSVTCTSSSHTEGTATFDVYVIDSIASRGSRINGGFGDPTYVQRELKAVVTNAP